MSGQDGIGPPVTLTSSTRSRDSRTGGRMRRVGQAEAPPPSSCPLHPLVSLTIYSLVWNKNRPIFALLRLLHHLLQSTPLLPRPPASPPSPLLPLPARETPLQARPSRSRGRAYTRGMAHRSPLVRFTRRPTQQHGVRAHATKRRLRKRRPGRRDPDASDACY